MSAIQAVRLSSSHDPEQRGEVAFQHFCTPRLSSYRSPDHELLAERARFHLRNAASARVATSEGEIQAYVFEPEPSAATGASVLLVHGWTAEASFMTAFAEHFRKRGLRAVLFDLPAHGKSAGERTSLIACAHVVRQIAEALGPIQYVVGHSLGGLAALLAGGGGAPMPRAYPFLDYVLVAVPNRFAEVTRKFGAELGLSPAAQRAYERRLEGIAHRAIADFTAVSLLAATGRPRSSCMRATTPMSRLPMPRRSPRHPAPCGCSSATAWGIARSSMPRRSCAVRLPISCASARVWPRAPSLRRCRRPPRRQLIYSGTPRFFSSSRASCSISRPSCAPQRCPSVMDWRMMSGWTAMNLTPAGDL